MNVVLAKSKMAGAKIESVFKLYEQYEKYQAKFDKRKMQKEWRMVEPTTIEGNKLSL